MKDATRIKQLVPKAVVSTGRNVFYLACDAIDTLLGRRDPLIPPRRLMFEGPRDISVFKQNGEEFLRYYIELCNLRPDAKILDVGCGIGRKTIPLTRYLNGEATYEGFDIVKAGLDWCVEHISAKYPNFHFHLADLFNPHYNSSGKYKADEYKFPFQSGHFDFTAIGSVFTHMLPDGVDNYLGEVARVLKKEGKCLATFFLWNDEARELTKNGRSALSFSYESDRFRTINPRVPEDTVCYEESFVMVLYKKHGLAIDEPIRYGSWCGRRNFLSYQDIIVATKA
jgi:SAM-dependent methyltransferase